MLVCVCARGLVIILLFLGRAVRLIDVNRCLKAMSELFHLDVRDVWLKFKFGGCLICVNVYLKLLFWEMFVHIC